MNTQTGAMAHQSNETDFTADAFFVWAADRPGRFELSDGRIVAMAPERVAHARAKLRAVNALAGAIAAKALGCEAMTDGVSVRIDDRTVYEPDALVRCGPPTPDDAIEISDPLVAVEILSPSSRGLDTGLKLAGYFRLPSLRHYLVVNADGRTVLHHRRDDSGAIGVEIVREGALALEPPGLAIRLDDLFPA